MGKCKPGLCERMMVAVASEFLGRPNDKKINPALRKPLQRLLYF
jgi:hypothetical protein